MKPTRFLVLVGTLLLLSACDNPADQENASLNEELTALQTQVDEFDAQVTSQTEELETARQRVSELEAQLAEQEQQVGQAEAIEEERNNLRQQLLERQTALEDAQARIQNLEQRRELTLEERLETIDQQLERLRQERSALNQQLETAGDPAGGAAQEPQEPTDAAPQPSGSLQEQPAQNPASEEDTDEGP